MVKHATSHGASVLFCTIIAAFLVEILKFKLPELIENLESFSYKAVILFNIPLSVQSFSIILISSSLAIIWGIFFKIRYS